MHDEPSINSITFTNKFLFSPRGMNQQHIGFSLLPHGHGLAGTYCDCLDKIPRVFLKDWEKEERQVKHPAAELRGVLLGVWNSEIRNFVLFGIG